MTRFTRLRHEFTIDCYDQEDVPGKDGVFRYHIAIAALGVTVRSDGAWQVFRPLIEGHGVSDGRKAWLDWDRPIKHPPGMDLIDAHHVLMAAFNHLGRGKDYDGDMTSMPIDLGFWLAEHLNLPVAHQVERALRGAVVTNNAAGTN
jgi:hypothetical protein